MVAAKIVEYIALPISVIGICFWFFNEFLSTFNIAGIPVYGNISLFIAAWLPYILYKILLVGEPKNTVRKIVREIKKERESE